MAFLLLGFVTSSCTKEKQPDPSLLYNTWKCTYSIDYNDEDSYENSIKGATLSIFPTGRYESSSRQLGRKGTYTTNGNTFHATAESGDSFDAKFEVTESTLVLSGEANGYTFKYNFVVYN